MEPVIDFGLFELLAASGLAWIGRHVYARRRLALCLLLASVVVPVVLVIRSADESARWLAALAVALALVNAAVLLPLTLNGRLPALMSRGAADTSQV